MELNWPLARIICVHCETVLRPSFVTCTAGHIVCPHCTSHTDNTSNVVQCEATEIKLTFLNIIFKDVLDNCQYNCGHRGNVLCLKRHETTCRKRIAPIDCLIPSCDWSESFDTLAHHFKAAHPFNLLQLPNSPDDGFSLQSDNSVMLICQFNIEMLFNELYCLRLRQIGENRYALMEHIGHTGDKLDVNQKLDKFTISFEENITMAITGNIYEATGEKLVGIEYLIKTGIDISALKEGKYLLTMKNSKLHEIPKELRQDLECEICTQVMSGKIPQCDKGHSFCSNCARKLNKCPKCTCSIKNVRNYFLEEFLEKYDAACAFCAAGCPVVTSNKHMEKHIRNCVFRPTRCFRNCDFKGCHRDFVPHVISKHGDSEYVFNKQYTVTVPENSQKSVRNCFTVYGQLFVVVMTFDDDFAFSVFHVIDGHSDFNFSASFWNNVTENSVSFSLPCEAAPMYNIKKKSLTTIKDNPCRISRNLFVNLICDCDKEFEYMINIFKST